MRSVNETISAAPQKRIDILISQSAEKHPDKTAVCFAGETLSYKGLEKRANGVAEALLSNEVSIGELVGIYMDRSILIPAALLGVIKSGAAYVPMDPLYPAQRIRWMVEDASLKVVLTDAAHEKEVREFGVEPLLVETLELAEGHSGSISTSLDSLAYVIFTSGSTGRPKGVPVPHGALTNFLVSMQTKPGMGADDVLLAVTTLSFDISGLEIFLPLLTGGRLVIASREMAVDGGALLQLIKDESITIMQATPVTWKLMLHAGWESTPGLSVWCGGEAFPRDLANTLLSKARSVWNMYGPTETTIWSTCDKVEKGEGAVSIGMPIANTTVYVVDETLNPVRYGEEGELLIGGAGLASGYLKNKHMTNEKFITLDPSGERVYRTGDLARFMSDGRLECLGRLDHQVKLRGFRIELEDIESALRGHKVVRDAVVILYAGDEDPFLAAYLILESPVSEGDGGATEFFRTWLSDRLPTYMVPSCFTVLNFFPRTPNGKLDRTSLPAPAIAGGLCVDVEYESETEAVLAEIWKKILGLENIPRQVDFFALGGNSIKGAELIVRINERFDRDLSLSVLAHSSTLEDLSCFIVKYEEGADDALKGFKSLKLVQKGKAGVVPLFLIHAGDGHVLPFKDLARNLKADQPVYAFKWSGRDGGVIDLDLKVQARSYMEEMLAFNPGGPFRVGGYCHGGFVAIELVRYLRDAGATVLDPLVVLGAPNVKAKSYHRREPTSSKKSWREFEQVRAEMTQKKIVDDNEILPYVSPYGNSGLLRIMKQSLPYTMARKIRNRIRLDRLSKDALAGIKVPQEELDWYCGTSSSICISNHKSSIYNGHVLCFQSGVYHGSELFLPGWWSSPYLGFEELCCGHFEGYIIGGAQSELCTHPEIAKIMTEKFDESHSL